MDFAPPSAPSVTEMLERARQGEPMVWNEIYTSLYRDLYRLAQTQLWRSSDHSMTPTSLISETWLRVMLKRDIFAENRRQLISLLISAMRSTVIDETRRRCSEKRGGNAEFSPLSESEIPAERIGLDDLLALNRALETLEKIHPRLAQVVEWRYFGGMSENDISSVLGVHVRTVRRDWQTARAFLLRNIAGADFSAEIDAH